MATYYTILTIYLVFAFLSSLTATLTLPKFKHTPVKLAVPILWAGFIAETSGWLYSEYVTLNNHWIFNIYNFIYGVLFYKMLYDLLKSKIRKKIVLIVGGIVLLIYITISAINTFDAQAIIYGGHLMTLAFIFFVLLYAVELLKSDTVLSLRESPQFFFITGYLVFEIVYAPLSIAYDLDLHVFSEAFYITLKAVQGYVLMAMHSLFIFGFLWTKRAVVE